MTQTAKRTLRHLALALGSGAATYGVYTILVADDRRFKLSMATAYVGLALLVATLAIGPWNVLRSRPNPVSTNLRRDVAIWAAIVSLVHVGVGFTVHMRGFMWQYLIFPPEAHKLIPLRYDYFGFANWTGLGAGLVLLLLLALSNDLSLRWLGTTRWKAIQRWSYWAFGLILLHAAVYEISAKRDWPWVLVSVALVAAAGAVQAAGFRRVREGRGARGAEGT